jgi:CRISPR-associated endoribonuclease Cas6
MPSRWRITLPTIDPSQVRLEHLHAVVSGWFDTNPDTHRAAAKPYSITPPAACAAGTAVEIGLLDDTLVDRLLTCAAPGKTVRLGTQHTRLCAAPDQVAVLTWAQAAAAGGMDAWCLRFVTPTTFRRGNLFTPWPAPKAVLGSLRAAWRRFAPPDLPPLILELTPEPVWVTDIDGANQVLKVNDRTVSGFVGRIRFAADAPDPVAAAIDQLVRLAPFAGVGAYTTRGFGMTRPEPTWQHTPTPRHPVKDGAVR